MWQSILELYASVFAWYYVLWFIVICDMHDSEFIELGPVGPQSYGTKRVPQRYSTRGSTELQPWVADMCLCGILGNSLSIYAYSVMCGVSGTSDDRGKALAWLVHTHAGGFGYNWSWDLICFVLWLWYIGFFGTIYVFKKLKIVWKITLLQVGIRAFVWGIRVHLRMNLNSNWGIEKVFHKTNNFSKRVKGFEKDRKEQCVQSASTRTVISQNTLTLWVMRYVMIWYAC